MARPRTRTTQLIRDDMVRMRDLFGTIRNAYRCLALEGRISYASFQHALVWGYITEDEKDEIESQWHQWKQTYLVYQCPLGFRLGDK